MIQLAKEDATTNNTDNTPITSNKITVKQINQPLTSNLETTKRTRYCDYIVANGTVIRNLPLNICPLCLITLFRVSTSKQIFRSIVTLSLVYRY